MHQNLGGRETRFRRDESEPTNQSRRWSNNRVSVRGGVKRSSALILKRDLHIVQPMISLGTWHDPSSLNLCWRIAIQFSGKHGTGIDLDSCRSRGPVPIQKIVGGIAWMNDIAFSFRNMYAGCTHIKVMSFISIDPDSKCL